MNNYLNQNGSVNWKDNPELRDKMYKSLKRRTGKYVVGITGQNGKTPGMTGKDLNNMLKEIAVEVGLPEGKWNTIGQQIAWCCTAQKYINLTNSLKSSYSNNKAAAIIAGYMTLDDVFLLNK